MDQPNARPLTGAQLTLAAVAGLLFAAMAVLGGVGSFASVRDLAVAWFGALAWIVPIGVDLGILALVSVALLFEGLGMPMPALRWVAWAFTAATVWLNVSAARGDPAGIIAHAAMPVLFVVFIEAVRHAIRRRTGIAAGTLREGVPLARWLLAPCSTFLLWRRMVLWQQTSYRDALHTDVSRRHALTVLRDRYGSRWRRTAPADVVWMLRTGVMITHAAAQVSELTAADQPAVRSADRSWSGQTDADLVADMRQRWPHRPSREQIRRTYGIGTGRARRLLSHYDPPDGPTGPTATDRRRPVRPVRPTGQHARDRPTLRPVPTPDGPN